MDFEVGRILHSIFYFVDGSCADGLSFLHARYGSVDVGEFVQLLVAFTVLRIEWPISGSCSRFLWDIVTLRW